MAVTPSVMLPLSTKLPSFHLLDTRTEQQFSSDTLSGKKVLVGFICNHCPFVVHILAPLTAHCNQLMQQGIEVVMISANNPITHPQDAPDKMTALAKSAGFTFPYCFDESQDVARAFQAACTPEFYLFNDQHELIYRGQFDASRPSNDVPVTGQDLLDAVHLSKESRIRETQTASVGCGIKWK